jgi:hypothetical protein
MTSPHLAPARPKTPTRRPRPSPLPLTRGEVDVAASSPLTSPLRWGEQLELFDRFDDGLSWDEWFRSLPLNPWEER